MNICTALSIETNLPYVSRRESCTKILVNIEIRVSVGSPNILSSIASTWLNPQGRIDCDRSCNLWRDYQNLAYHGLLDWRLALDMARLVSNPTSIVDLSSPWSSHFPNPWLSLVQNAVPATVQRLGYGSGTLFKPLQVTFTVI